MKTVLCFGDSNTWGYIPASDFERFDYATRWPGVMAESLGSDFLVVENGLSGRTTAWDDPLFLARNGRAQLPVVLDTHAPFDLVLIMLGTNDVKHHLGLSADDIAGGAACLVEDVRTSGAGPAKSAPQVALVAPPPITESCRIYGHQFDGAVEKSSDFGRAFAEIARELNCPFLDAGSVVTSSDEDGLHLAADAHRQLAVAMAAFVREIISAA